MLTFSLPQTSPLSIASHIWPIYLVCIAWWATLIRISNLETNGYSDLPNKIWLLFLFSSKSFPWNVDNNLIAKPDFFSPFSSLLITLQWHSCPSKHQFTWILMSHSGFLLPLWCCPSPLFFLSSLCILAISFLSPSSSLLLWVLLKIFSDSMFPISVLCDSVFKLVQLKHGGGLESTVGIPDFAMRQLRNLGWSPYVLLTCTSKHGK